MSYDRLKWDRRYMEMAGLVSTWSKDPGTKVGAVCVGIHGQILATGYNGFPRGIDDSQVRLHDRVTKLMYTIHAEPNCVYNASLTGVSLEYSTIYVHGLPTCSECAKSIIQSGISRLVIEESTIDTKPEWAASWKISREMLTEAGVKVDILSPRLLDNDVQSVVETEYTSKLISELTEEEMLQYERVRRAHMVTLEDEIGESDYTADVNDRGC